MTRPLVRKLGEAETARVVEAAYAALRQGDLPGGLSQLAIAIGQDPANGEWLGVLNRMVEHYGERILTAIRLEPKQPDPLSAAVFAYLLGVLGQYRDALAALCSVAHLCPEVPYLTWATQWLKKPGVTASIPYDFVHSVILGPMLQLGQEMPHPLDQDDPRRPTLTAAAEMLGLLRNVNPFAPHLLHTSAVVLRCLGEWEDAVELAKHASQLLPDFEHIAGLAAAYRDAGLVDKAITVYREALDHDPTLVPPRLELADLCLEHKRYKEAIETYLEVLDNEPDNGWARASLEYARFESTGLPAHRVALSRMIETSPRAFSLFGRLQTLEPYFHFLPWPGDETARALSEVMVRIDKDPSSAQGRTLTLGVTHPESPSVFTAFRLWCEQKGIQVNVDLQIPLLSSPDSRYPRAPVDFVLWVYDGMRPRPAVGPPDVRAVKAIADLAREPYNLELWEPQASWMASAMGPAWLGALLGVMVYPPPLPPAMDPMAWVLRVQMACALVIGFLDAEWEGSVRKRALYSLACGPVDWTVDAAVVILARLARQEPRLRQDVESLFQWLFSQVPQDESYTSYEYPLVCGWLSLPGHDQAIQNRLETCKTRIEEKTPRVMRLLVTHPEAGDR